MPRLFLPAPFQAFIMLLWFSQSATAAVNDIFPGDYFPAKPGMTTITAYAYAREQSGPYVQGKLAYDGKIDTSILAMRLVKTGQMGSTVVSGVLVLPWSDARVSPAPLASLLGANSTGMADLRIGMTAWMINDPAHAHYLAISGMVVAPTGHYSDAQTVNVGENRWRTILSAGWQKDISPRFLVELSPEVAIYGDNDKYVGQRRLEQQASYALTGYLRWRAAPTWHLSVGSQVNRGGATRINGIDQNNPANNDRLVAGSTWFLPGLKQVILRVSKDARIENGFRTGLEVALRLQKTF